MKGLIQASRKAAFFFLLALPLGSSVAAYAAEWKAGRLIVDSPLYTKPDGTSPVIVQYPKGTPLKAYFPDRSGWVTVYLPQPINGVQYAWIPTNRLQIQDSPPPQSPTPRKSTPPSSSSNLLQDNWIGVGAGAVMASPSDYQTGIGEVQASITSLRYEGEFGHYLSPRIYGIVRGGTYSFKQAETIVTGSTAFYSANGFYGMVGLGYMFTRSPRFALGLEGNAGFSLSNVSDATATQLITTSSIMGIPIRVGLRSQLKIAGRLGLELTAGYEIHSLSQIQSYYLPDGSTVTPNMSLGGLTFGGKLAFRF